MVFYKKSGVGYRQVMEGIRLKTLVHGEKTLLCEFRIKKGK
ncbi:MAG: cupin domain-containing protein, partial [Dehalococcoidia bacterium]